VKYDTDHVRKLLCDARDRTMELNEQLKRARTGAENFGDALEALAPEVRRKLAGFDFPHTYTQDRWGARIENPRADIEAEVKRLLPPELWVRYEADKRKLPNLIMTLPPGCRLEPFARAKPVIDPIDDSNVVWVPVDPQKERIALRKLEEMRVLPRGSAAGWPAVPRSVDIKFFAIGSHVGFGRWWRGLDKFPLWLSATWLVLRYLGKL